MKTIYSDDHWGHEGADEFHLGEMGPTFKKDPISQFRLDNDHYSRIGEHIAAFGLPSLFVMEGGYAVEEIGINTANVLTGFEQAV